MTTTNRHQGLLRVGCCPSMTRCQAYSFLPGRIQRPRHRLKERGRESSIHHRLRTTAIVEPLVHLERITETNQQLQVPRLCRNCCTPSSCSLAILWRYALTNAI